MAGEAATGDELLSSVGRAGPHVLVLDISMPGPGFLETMRLLRESHPRIRILVLSLYPENLYAVRSLRAGASGYLTKSRSVAELLQAIRRIHRGGKYITSSLGEKLAAHLEEDASEPTHERLSDREYQVLIALAKGKPIKQIGTELHLSPKTITTYRSRILEKMDLESTAELIRYALENRLLDDDSRTSSAL